VAIYNLYSKRQRNLQSEPVEYGYDEISDVLKVQIVHIWNDILGD